MNRCEQLCDVPAHSLLQGSASQRKLRSVRLLDNTKLQQQPPSLGPLLAGYCACNPSSPPRGRPERLLGGWRPARQQHTEARGCKLAPCAEQVLGALLRLYKLAGPGTVHARQHEAGNRQYKVPPGAKLGGDSIALSFNLGAWWGLSSDWERCTSGGAAENASTSVLQQYAAN